MLGYNALFFFSIFPIWIIKFKFPLNDYIFIGLVILLLLFVNYLLLNLLKNKKKLFNTYIAVILTIGVDNSFSLHNDIVLPNKEFFLPIFNNVYFSSLFIIFTIFLINFLICRKLQNKGITIVFSLIFSIFIFNTIDNSKSYKNINNFTKGENFLEVKNPKIVFLLDEMGGLNSHESNSELGQKFDKMAIEFAKKHEFIIYTNVYSNFPQSIRSISKLLNQDVSKTINEKDYSELSRNFYTEHNITKNKLFDSFDSISVFQGMHINYCKNNNVKKCEQFNQFLQTNYMKGFKDTFLTRIVNAWKLYGTSIGAITWRILIQIELIDAFEKSSGEKAAFLNLLHKIKKDINSKKYGLIFAHSMITHRPFGYDVNCNYSGANAIGSYGLINEKEKIRRHNLDRICAIKFLDKFFDELKNINAYKNLDILILSDHGARIRENNPESMLKSIFLHRKKNSSYSEIKEKNTTQKIFFEKIVN